MPITNPIKVAEFFKDKNLKVSYKTKEGEITGDEGLYYASDAVWFVLELFETKKLKWIPIANIVRVQQL
jgi:hypothetical protein